MTFIFFLYLLLNVMALQGRDKHQEEHLTALGRQTKGGKTWSIGGMIYCNLLN